MAKTSVVMSQYIGINLFGNLNNRDCAETSSRRKKRCCHFHRKEESGHVIHVMVTLLFFMPYSRSTPWRCFGVGPSGQTTS